MQEEKDRLRWEEVGVRRQREAEEVHHQNPAAQAARQFPLGRVSPCKIRRIPVMQK